MTDSALLATHIAQQMAALLNQTSRDVMPSTSLATTNTSWSSGVMNNFMEKRQPRMTNLNPNFDFCQAM